MSVSNPDLPTNKELVAPTERIYDPTVLEKIRSELVNKNVIFVDMDGVLGFQKVKPGSSPFSFDIVGYNPNIVTIDTLKILKELGITLVLFTAANRQAIKFVNSCCNNVITDLFSGRIISAENWVENINSPEVFIYETKQLLKLLKELTWETTPVEDSRHIYKEQLETAISQIDLSKSYLPGSFPHQAYQKSIQLFCEKGILIDDFDNTSVLTYTFKDLNREFPNHITIKPTRFNNEYEGYNDKIKQNHPVFNEQYIPVIKNFFNIN